jgi:hypothetical protein
LDGELPGNLRRLLTTCPLLKLPDPWQFEVILYELSFGTRFASDMEVTAPVRLDRGVLHVDNTANVFTTLDLDERADLYFRYPLPSMFARGGEVRLA